MEAAARHYEHALLISSSMEAVARARRPRGADLSACLRRRPAGRNTPCSAAALTHPQLHISIRVFSCEQSVIWLFLWASLTACYKQGRSSICLLLDTTEMGITQEVVNLSKDAYR
ncbi:uncharacterized protein LOC124667595 [Lolium rigidum]|uniref:uncharacterized protein LOC124667595 n=1 Tax=Lolium rigidum TaxID=89674 RepID=UPI001F5D3E3F|nr:uncharacterized protein LOC124667595 [Lolium rigidum]